MASTVQVSALTSSTIRPKSLGAYLFTRPLASSSTGAYLLANTLVSIPFLFICTLVYSLIA